MKRYVYDYYTIQLPGDFTDDPTDIANQAIAEARERAKLYVVPCMWYVRKVIGEIGDWSVTVLVARKRNRRVVV